MDLPIRIISTDFDGTIHSDLEEPPVPPALQELIGELQSKGATWIINTGREFHSLMETLESCQISIQPDYLVTVEREIHFRNGSGYLPVEDWNRACQSANQRLFDRVNSKIPELTADLTNRYAVRIYEDAFSPLCFIAESNDDSDEICQYLEEHFGSEPDLSVVRNDIYGRLSHSGFNKGSALSEIGRLLGIGPEYTVAAGDHMNDLPMLDHDHARWLIAPGNAVKVVKETVRNQEGFVSSEHYGNGVAAGLKHWLRYLSNGHGFSEEENRKRH